MVEGGGSAGGSLPSPSTKDPLNKAREEVVEKQVNNVSGWSCILVGDELSNTSVVALPIGNVTSFPLADPGLEVLKDIGPKALGFGAKALGVIKSAAPWIVGITIIFTPEKAGETEEELEAYFDSLEKAEQSENENNGKEQKKDEGKRTFPDNPEDFNPEGLEKREYNNGKIKKWHNPTTGKAEWEWSEDLKNGSHYHRTPDGKNRVPHPETGDTHYWPGDDIPR